MVTPFVITEFLLPFSPISIVYIPLAALRAKQKIYCRIHTVSLHVATENDFLCVRISRGFLCPLLIASCTVTISARQTKHLPSVALINENRRTSQNWTEWRQSWWIPLKKRDILWYSNGTDFQIEGISARNGSNVFQCTVRWRWELRNVILWKLSPPKN